MEEWNWLAEGPAQDDSAPADAQSADDIVEALIEADRRNANLRRDAENILFKREATRLADALERKDDRRPVRRSLTEQLQQPLQPQLYAIEELLPLAGNALFAGRYKAGKSTFNGQLLRAWADDLPFLGKFACHPDPERPVVTIFNYEMSEDLFQRWLMRVGITNTDNVFVVHLRGLTLPLSDAGIRREMSGWLRDSRTGLWIVDPASRAMAGDGDGDKNGDVSRWLGYLDEVKLEAGVRDLVLNIHMGHASAKDKDAERAIGAQAWSAWADALWYLNLIKDKDGGVTRTFSAEGRDVEVEKLMVNYDATDMSVALVDHLDAAEAEEKALRSAVQRVVMNNPGITVTGVRSQAQAIHSTRVTEYDRMLDQLIREDLVRVIVKGRGRHHYWHDQMPDRMP